MFFIFRLGLGLGGMLFRKTACRTSKEALENLLMRLLNQVKHNVNGNDL